MVIYEKSLRKLIIPDGLEGYTQADIDAAFQSGYTEGNADGYTDGYADGLDDGAEEQKSLLEPITITENGTYEREDGYSSILVNVASGETINNQVKSSNLTVNGTYIVTYDSGYTGLQRVDITVNVPQTGYTQADIDAAYNSGYTGGYTDGYNDAPTGYTQEDLNEAYNEGYNDGLADCGTPHIGVDITDISFSSSGDNETITIQSNVGWNIVSTPEWISVSPTSGTGNSSIVVTASANTGYSRNGNIIIQSLDSSITVTIFVEQSGDYTPSDYTNIPMGFEILSDGEIVWIAKNPDFVKTIEYKKNNNSWTEITSSTSGTSITVKRGDFISFRGNNKQYAQSNTVYNRFNIKCNVNLYGNIMSLINSSNFSGLTTLESAYTFSHLFFNNGKIYSVNNLVLPATTLTDYCYQSMFYGCRRLTNAPALPATTLALGCYEYMFQSCRALTVAPVLPATTLAEGCYAYMFEFCTSLTTAPELPATTLATACYTSMFSNCTSLVNAPTILPATTLASRCYHYMFTDCTSLQTAPELPATSLHSWCYTLMFDGCTNLNYIKCLATYLSSSNSTTGWVNGVQTTSGTFVKTAGVNWPSGNDGIPVGWTIQDAS